MKIMDYEALERRIEGLNGNMGDLHERFGLLYRYYDQLGEVARSNRGIVLINGVELEGETGSIVYLQHDIDPLERDYPGPQQGGNFSYSLWFRSADRSSSTSVHSGGFYWSPDYRYEGMDSRELYASLLDCEETYDMAHAAAHDPELNPELARKLAGSNILMLDAHQPQEVFA